MKSARTTTPNQKPIDFRKNGTLYSLEPIKPKRFIWHVTAKRNRESISRRGLIPHEKLVFANNQNLSIQKMWRVMDNLYEAWVYFLFSDRHAFDWTAERDLICKDLDFWRIDTEISECQWFIDPFLANGYDHCGGLSARHYICTPQRIFPEALQLYTFDAAMENKLFIKQYDGCASVGLSTLPLKRAS